VLAMLKVYQL